MLTVIFTVVVALAIGATNGQWPTTAEPEPYPETTWGWNWGTTARPYQNCSRCMYDMCSDWNSDTCQWGCKSGLWGDADPWSWFNNLDCSKECSENCGMDEYQWTRPCNKTSGSCLNGCVNGTYGLHCDKICPLGCDWGWGCEVFDKEEEIFSCPLAQICRECGCQGQQCVDDGWPSSAPILSLSSFISLTAFLTHMFA